MMPQAFIDDINIALNSELGDRCRDPRHAALNSYDYRCLKYEVEGLKALTDEPFEQICPTLDWVIYQTENAVDANYPVRPTPYQIMGKHGAYQYLRLIDEILYTAESSLTVDEIAERFIRLVDQRGIRLSHRPASTASLVEAVGKRLNDLQSLIDCEFNGGNTQRFRRGSLQPVRNYWRSPLMQGGEDGERVSAFKMTLAFHEIVNIIREIGRLKRSVEIYRNDDDLFKQDFPLLALLGDDLCAEGFLSGQKLTAVKYTPSLKTVQYSSTYSSRAQFIAEIGNAVSQGYALDIEIARRGRFAVLPYELRKMEDGLYLYGWHVYDKTNMRIPFDWIRSVEKSRIAVNYTDFANLTPRTYEKVEVSLTLESWPSSLAVDRMKEYGIDCLESRTERKCYSRKECTTYLKVKAEIDFVFFELLANLQNRSILYDIAPADVKQQYEDHWDKLYRKQVVRNYGVFNGRKKSARNQF